MINKASADPQYNSHPGLTKYGIESYIAVPLMRRDGSYFGTLCALDPRPASLSPANFQVFHLLARLISFELEAEENERQRVLDIAEMQRTAEFRERFISILGHDLQNPISAISLSAFTVLGYRRLPPEYAEAAEEILKSAERMGQMVDDILDFTRSRLGGEIPIEKVDADVRELWSQMIQELQTTNPDREIRISVEGDTYCECDPGRIGRVASNLLSNALRYGPLDRPVEVTVRGTDADITMTVTNYGPPISPDILERIFDPYYRHTAADGRIKRSRGLGLGLYIVEQIVQGHGGSIGVKSTAESGTTFTIRLPR